MAASTRRWQPPPAPTILNLPRRSRLPRQSRDAAPLGAGLDPHDHERSARSGESGGDSGGEERWRFQAEILRAECNFLRMEREVALRKLERNRAQMEIALKCAVDTLVSGRKKIEGSGSGSVEAALDEGIEELEEKLEELRLGSSSGRGRRSRGSSRKLLPSSCRRNFDRQASALRRQLEQMEENTCVKDILEISVPALAKKNSETEQHGEENATPGSNHSTPRFPNDMEILKRKMEGMSRGLLERMEECSYLLSANNGSSTSSRSSSSKSECNGSRQKIIGYNDAAADKAPDPAFLQIQPQQQQQQEKLVEEKMELPSCCNCKEVVGRIMQQVRAESEQWSEMQVMLEQVRMEMEELRSSRDHWQRRAIASEINFHSQHTQKLEWKQRSRSTERKVIELKKLVKELQKELQPSKTKLLNTPSSSPLQSELWHADTLRMAQKQQMRSLDTTYKEKEKHVLVCHLKSQNNASSRRSPLQDIDNISPLLRSRS